MCNYGCSTACAFEGHNSWHTLVYPYLIWNDRCFIDDNVEKSKDVSTIAKVEKERGVTMNETALRQNFNLELVDDRSDLKICFEIMIKSNMS